MFDSGVTGELIGMNSHNGDILYLMTSVFDIKDDYILDKQDATLMTSDFQIHLFVICWEDWVYYNKLATSLMA